MDTPTHYLTILLRTEYSARLPLEKIRTYTNTHGDEAWPKGGQHGFDDLLDCFHLLLSTLLAN